LNLIIIKLKKIIKINNHFFKHDDIICFLMNN